MGLKIGPKSLEIGFGRRPGRIFKNPFKKVPEISQKLTPLNLEKWAPVEARAQFSLSQGDAKNDQKWPSKVSPRSSFWDQFGIKMPKNVLRKINYEIMSKNDAKYGPIGPHLGLLFRPENRLFWGLDHPWVPLGLPSTKIGPHTAYWHQKCKDLGPKNDKNQQTIR